MFVHSEEKVYDFQSIGSESVCGIYIIAGPHQLVKFTFETFFTSCANGGLLSVVDGWELNGQFFPGLDSNHERKKRYQEYCGSVQPVGTMKTSQNVGLVEFRIPQKGEGFRVRVSFVDNPRRELYHIYLLSFYFL